LLKVRGGAARVLGAHPAGFGYGRTLRRIGYVPQNTAGGSLPTTVREAVSIGRCASAGLCRPLTRRDRALVEAAMEQAGIAALAGAFVQELSGGQQQRVAIARALAMEAELLLLDEPAASLDKDGKKELLAIIERRRREARVSAIMVSHSPETLAACDECYLFTDGSARKMETVTEALNV
jgi:ABC-type Mn2+/Zn2+ transport system ATPase subunit